MRRDSLTSIVKNSATWVRITWIASLLVATLILSLIMGSLRFADAQIAPWWPAMGTAVLAVLCAKRHANLVIAIIFVLSSAANALTGSIWWVALVFGAANALEAWFIYTIMSRLHHNRWNSRTAEVVWFVVATAIAGAAAGAVIAFVLSFSGRPFYSVLLMLGASHISAVLIIAGFGVIPLDSLRVRRPFELLVQLGILAVSLVITFVPGQSLQLEFLPFVVIAWAAFRFGVGIVLLEVAITSLIAVVFGAIGGGPFAAAAIFDPGLLLALNQLYTLSLGISMLLLATAQNERNILARHMAAREEILQGSLVSANGGFLILERGDHQRFTLIQANPTADRLMPEWSAQLYADGTHRLADTLLELPGLLDANVPSSTAQIKWNDRLLSIRVAQVSDSLQNTVLIQTVDITDAKLAEAALERALEQERAVSAEMRKLSSQKDDFVSSVSHELRTPVTSIIGYAEELEESDLNREDRELLEVITRNAHRLSELIENLLTSSSLTATDRYVPSEINLAQVCRDATTDQSRQATAKEVHLTIQSPFEVCVVADPLWMHRIITNLVSNAIKFARPGDSVEVTLSTDAKCATVRVEDSGPGISSEDLEKVFDRFYRVIDPVSGYVPGTGLGLPISRTLVTRMGGQIWLESDGVSGTTAIVRIPLSSQA